jgi:hypothetical protein
MSPGNHVQPSTDTLGRKMIPNLECLILALKCQTIRHDLQQHNLINQNSNALIQNFPGISLGKCIRKELTFGGRFWDDDIIWWILVFALKVWYTCVRYPIIAIILTTELEFRSSTVTFPKISTSSQKWVRFHSWISARVCIKINI